MSIFSKVKVNKVKTSVFNLSEEMKLSCNFGDIVPILCKEVLPNDKFKIDTELLIKMAPLKAPVMHRIKAKVDYFFVPNYQLCDAFENFINPKVNTADNPIVLPYLHLEDIEAAIAGEGQAHDHSKMIGSLPDYLGLPVQEDTGSAWQDDTMFISALPFMCYQHIYNCYYRDQNLQPFNDTDLLENVFWKNRTGHLTNTLTPDNIKALLTLRKSAWKKDYFTSALPSPQAGDDVMIPLLGSAPVSGSNVVLGSEDTSEIVTFIGGNTPADGAAFKASTVRGEGRGILYETAEGGYDFMHGLIGGFKGAEADLSQASSVSINDLRKLFSLQKFKELAERGGTRYTEMVRNFFGAFLPDIYFDRPLYLGGQVQPVQIGEVVSTTSNPDSEAGGTFLGFRGGIANSYGKTRTVTYKSNSHGFIMGLLRILPEATYSQGIERMWTRENIFDYAFPQFANLGEQEIKSKELFLSFVPSKNEEVFGYIPRYAEYKEGHCHIAGKFRTDLAYWHFGRYFSDQPKLNAEFITGGQNNYAPFYVTDSDVEHVYVNLYNHIIARRPLPYFGTPLGI